ncbi:MAG: VIT1/CCC1 transporter family protein [Microgenomates group bacterium]
MKNIQSFKKSIRTGFGFGITSGVITTLGLMIGLNSGTHSKPAVLGGILTIAVADAFSDALGIHISEESKGTHTPKEVWTATISTFLAKFIFALSFILPLILFPLNQAVIVSIILGLFYLGFFSYYMSKRQKQDPLPIILEHVIVALFVIVISHLIGDLINNFFN